ncbi:MAG: CARDB domain-containing protein, partial [Dehalococcoidia bacterium]|nr:CARDB domain-containing protein [Dehalococcoidia bacterium]
SIRLVGPGIDRELGTHSNSALDSGQSTHQHIASATIPTGIGNGTYTLIVEVDPDGQVNESDDTNNSVSATIRIGSAVLLGDTNGDNVVDYRDLAMLGAAYGTNEGESAFDVRVDFNGDAIIDYRDLAMLGANYGQER